MTERTQDIILGDCIEGLKELKDNSVDIIIVDPPYILVKTLEMIVINKT